MPHRLTHNKEQAKKRRELIWLSATSSVLIIIMWIFYMQYTFTQKNDAVIAPQAQPISILKAGLNAIVDTIETGFVNSYIYFHTVASEGKTFTITK